MPQEPQQHAEPPGPLSSEQENEQRPQQQRRQGQNEPWYRGVIRLILVWFVIQWGVGLLKQLTMGNNQQSGIKSSNNSMTKNESMDHVSSLPEQFVPFWPNDSFLDMHIFISEHENNTDFSNRVIFFKGINYGNWDDEREGSMEIIPSKLVQNNASLYAHIYLSRNNTPVNPSDPGFSETLVSRTTIQLNRYLKKRTIIKEKKLVGGSSQYDDSNLEKEKEGDSEKGSIASYWYPNVTLAIVSDFNSMAISSLPPNLRNYINLAPDHFRDENHRGFYYPILFQNDFWTLREHIYQRPINESVKSLPLNIRVHPISFLKFTIYAQIDFSIKQQGQKNLGGVSAGEIDEVKRMLMETNIYLLAITMIVSILHSVFEFMAFKSDISHWRNKEELTGISIRTILTNIIFQIIILLYLLDNNEETSWMILLGQVIGVAIEAWKITKAVNVKIERVNDSVIFPYRVRFHDKHVLTETEEKTREYDRVAFKYLSYVVYPLLLAYAIYSVFYDTHKSWYSFVVKTLVGFVYTWGFIAMTPQLYINYKLKSVAHMNMTTMIYKTIGTFVDDLFAFIVKMPMLHRLATLRDDVIFFIFLYQRWIYRVDPTRANEYGQVDRDALKEERAKVEKKSNNVDNKQEKQNMNEKKNQ